MTQRREAAAIDQQLWEQGVTLLAAVGTNAPQQVRERLVAAAERYASLKANMLAVTLAAGSDATCRSCNGQCCHNGKYRLSGFDLLAHLALGRPLPKPDFLRKPDCPYGTPDGCCMAPAMRPLDCVVFICSALEARLDEQGRLTLANAERELRQIVARSEEALKLRLGKPLLLLAEQAPSISGQNQHVPT